MYPLRLFYRDLRYIRTYLFVHTHKLNVAMFFFAFDFGKNNFFKIKIKTTMKYEIDLLCRL